MNEEMRLGLADNSMTMESEDTSTTLASKRRASSVKARRCEKVSRKASDPDNSSALLMEISDFRYTNTAALAYLPLGSWSGSHPRTLLHRQAWQWATARVNAQDQGWRP